MAWTGSNLEVPTPSENQLTTLENIMSPMTDTTIKIFTRKNIIVGITCDKTQHCRKAR